MSSAPLAIIMAGGSGTRFWPASSKECPKQFLNLWGNDSLIQGTVKRILPVVDRSRIFICSTQSQQNLIEKQLAEFAHPDWLILEPQARNTAPALMLSTLALQRQGVSDDTPVAVLAADHFIGNERGFTDLLSDAFAFAVSSKGLLTFGITPTSPHTGYGYIEAGKVVAGASRPFSAIHRFVEKPDFATAETYFHSGNFFWNSGMFVWTLGAIVQAFNTFMPTEWKLLSAAMPNPEKVYGQMPSVSVDVAIMEKVDNGYVIPAPDLKWSDVGSWDALYQLKRDLAPSSTDTNVTLSAKQVNSVESFGCLVKVGVTRQVALVGVEDLIVVEDGDKLLIARRSKDQLVKKITEG